LETSLKSFCEKNPDSYLCGGKTETLSLDDRIAQVSTEALTCAVNSVAVGKEQACVKKFTSADANIPSVRCYNKAELVCCDKGYFGGEYWTIRAECFAKGYSVEENKIGQCGDFYSEPKPELKCSVNNFNLPQELTKFTFPVISVESSAENWIKYLGDPKYLVYWQKFPQSQDTWTYRGDKWIHAMILGITVLPVGRIGSLVFKAATSKTLLAVSGKIPAMKNVALKLAGKTAEEAVATKAASEAVSRLVGRNTALGAAEAAEKATLEALKDIPAEKAFSAAKLAREEIIKRNPNSVLYMTEDFLVKTEKAAVEDALAAGAKIAEEATERGAAEGVKKSLEPIARQIYTDIAEKQGTKIAKEAAKNFIEERATAASKSAVEALRKAGETSEKAISDAATKAAMEEAERASSEYTRKETEKAITEAFEKKTLKKLDASSVLKESLAETAKSRLGPIKILKMAGKGATLELANYVAILVDSALSKYDPVPGKIVVKKPTLLKETEAEKERTEFKLESDAETIPVLIQSREKIESDLKPLHLVSPCKIDTLPVKKAHVFCGVYSFNTKTKELGCSNPIYFSGINSEYSELLAKIREQVPEIEIGLRDIEKESCQNFETSITLQNPASNEFVNSLEKLKGSSGKYLDNFYSSRTVKLTNGGTGYFGYAKIPIQTGIYLELSNFPSIEKDIGDKLVIEKQDGSKQELVFENFGTSDALGNTKLEEDKAWYQSLAEWYVKRDSFVKKPVTYVGRYRYKEDIYHPEPDILLYKKCEYRQDYKEMFCIAAIRIDNVCTDSSDVCRKLEALKSEKATLDRTWLAGFAGQTYDFNKLAIFGADTKPAIGNLNSGEGGTLVEILTDKYMVRYTDLNYDNKIDGVGIAKYESMPKEGLGLLSTKQIPKDMKKLVSISIADSDSDGIFETYGATNCITPTVYAEMLEAKKSDTIKSNYCVNQRGVVKASIEKAATWGGHIAIGTGAVVITIASGGSALPALVAGLVYAGGTGAVADFSEKFTGGWPDNGFGTSLG